MLPVAPSPAAPGNRDGVSGCCVGVSVNLGVAAVNYGVAAVNLAVIVINFSVSIINFVIIVINFSVSIVNFVIIVVNFAASIVNFGAAVLRVVDAYRNAGLCYTNKGDQIMSNEDWLPRYKERYARSAAGSLRPTDGLGRF
jgi:hypothetical protein